LVSPAWNVAWLLSPFFWMIVALLPSPIWALIELLIWLAVPPTCVLDTWLSSPA
jgi:hypothetical protein